MNNCNYNDNDNVLPLTTLGGITGFWYEQKITDKGVNKSDSSLAVPWKYPVPKCGVMPKLGRVACTGNDVRGWYVWVCYNSWKWTLLLGFVDKPFSTWEEASIFTFRGDETNLNDNAHLYMRIHGAGASNICYDDVGAFWASTRKTAEFYAGVNYFLATFKHGRERLYFIPKNQEPEKEPYIIVDWLAVNSGRKVAVYDNENLWMVLTY